MRGWGGLLRLDAMSTLTPDDPAKTSSLSTSATGAAKALVKGIALIDTVASASAPVRALRLAEMVDMPRPTVQRLLDVLIEAGLMQGNAVAGYTLGPHLAVWGQSYLDSLDLREQALEWMSRLSAETRETCFLGVRDNNQVLYVAKVDGPQPVRPAALVGMRNPLHSTAIGKILLSWAPEQTIREYTQGELEQRTPNTITDKHRLLEELEAVRQQGFAFDEVENEDGVRCVAAPIRDHRGEVAAAISVSAPAYRFSIEDLRHLTPRAVAAAHEISVRCGYGPLSSLGPTDPEDGDRA